MLSIEVPGYQTLHLGHLILDYNGTLACDGRLLPELIVPLKLLAQQLTLHVITADTHGSAAEQLAAIPCRLQVIAEHDQVQAKQRVVEQLGPEHCVAIGNGYNDQRLLQHAQLGIGLIQQEGAASATLQAADLVCLSCRDALELLLKPQRLIASLRR